MMKRYEIINHIIKNKGYKSYLEIGVREGECFMAIECDNKIGIDPAPSSKATQIISSDDFFNELDNETRFDIIFIDGLHLDYQVDKDIINSLEHLNEGGSIIIHDCNPPEKAYAGTQPIYDYPINGNWNGTVYLSIIKIRLYRKDLILKTVDSDWGVGILTRGNSKTLDYFPNDALDWDFFNMNRNNILNLISIENFRALYKI